MRAIRLLLIMLALLMWQAPAGAVWQTFRESDGLVSDETLSIYGDRDGNLWFGTRLGVSCYDGVTWTTYTVEDGLSKNTVLAIAQDHSGCMWFGTQGGGLTSFDGKEWHTYSSADVLPSDYVVSLFIDSSGVVWVGTIGGLCRYDGIEWSTYSMSQGLPYDVVYAMIEDSDGGILVGTGGGGLARFDGAAWKTLVRPYMDNDYDITTLTRDARGDLWCGTRSRGVMRFDGSQWSTYTAADGLAHDVIRDGCVDMYGNPWFATPAGVSRYDGTTWKTYTDADGLAHNSVVDVTQDPSGNLWFATLFGVTRFDCTSWCSYMSGEVLPDAPIHCCVEDCRGSIWFGTDGAGVCRYDGTNWTTHDSFAGYDLTRVYAAFEDRSGYLWFGGLGTCGAVCYDGNVWCPFPDVWRVHDIEQDASGDLWFATAEFGVYVLHGTKWTRYTVDDGLASNITRALHEDSRGNMWVGTSEGVSRFDGTTWTSYTTADGLAGDWVDAIAEDGVGDLWFGTSEGVSRFDGLTWTTYDGDDGLAGSRVTAIHRDRWGDLWFATRFDGVSRFSGQVFRTYSVGDGLVSNMVYDVYEGSSGAIWLSTSAGVTAHEPDRVAPQTVIHPKPNSLTTSTTQMLVYAAAFGEALGVSYSHCVDDSPWSDWTPATAWLANDLGDGEHVLAVRARDEVGNVDETPAIFDLEVDTTPPAPLISSPAYGDVVRDSVAIIGTASDMRFSAYLLEARRVGSTEWRFLEESETPVVAGTLAQWNTTSDSDGYYELRLSVSDTLGLTGRVSIDIVVDNEAPWASETTPALVSGSTGGDVFTTNEEVHLYFPPHAFADAATVTIEPAEGVPDTLAGGAELVLPGYDISWEGSDLAKAATLEMALGDERSSGDVLALYVLAEGADWRRLGGTVSGDAASISAPIEDEGTYAIYEDSGAGFGRGLSALTFTPRVFSPSGGYADDKVAIAFTLGRAGPVTVKVYNRAGRLVKELAGGVEMSAGANLVRWDGRDVGGAAVPDGLYVVTVESDGERRTETLAVVR